MDWAWASVRALGPQSAVGALRNVIRGDYVSVILRLIKYFYAIQ